MLRTTTLFSTTIATLFVSILFLLIGCGTPAVSSPLIVATFNQVVEPTQPIAAVTAISAEQQTLLNASTQIIMQRTLEDGTVLQAQGIATLITSNGHQKLVTHNHWGDYFDSNATATFYDAAGTLIFATSAKNLHSLRQFADDGMLIVTPFPELSAHLTAVPIHETADVSLGAALWVVHQISADVRGLQLTPVVVNEYAYFADYSVVTLQSTDGTAIIPGDSGGGLFANGQLLGNMWKTLVANNAAMEPTLLSKGSVYGEQARTIIADAQAQTTVQMQAETIDLGSVELIAQ